MKRILSIAIGALLLSGIALVAAHAQLATADLSLSTVPLDPQPLQSVQIRLQSFGFDLSQATITWNYNGTPIASGTGRTTVTVTAPANGQVGTVSATASSTDFSSTTATLLLRPASVDVIWEGADSYTPPFYKGRALPANNGLIRVTAIPAISAPRGLTYTWSENSSVLQNSSGYNKNSIVFQNDTLNTLENIGVTATSTNFSGNGSVSIAPVKPTVVGYFNTDGYIDYANGSTDSLSTADTGTIVHFEPYFFSTPLSISHDLTFAYTDSSGNNIETGDTQNELRLSRPDGGGQSQFTLVINTIMYSLQNLSRKFSVNFN